MVTHISSEDIDKMVANQYNVIIADLLVLANKILNYQWNISGSQVGYLQGILFRGLTMIESDIQSLFEGAINEGSRPAVNLTKALSLSRLTQYEEKKISAEAMIYAIVKDFNFLIGQIKEMMRRIKDVTQDLLSVLALCQELLNNYESYVTTLSTHIQ